MKARWAYRSRQFFTALLGRVDAGEMQKARRILGPGLYRFFKAMPAQYRRHALNVLQKVQGGGCDDPVVWQAALLHDSGKFDPGSGRYVTVGHRVAVVLLEAAPGGKGARERLAAWGRTSGPRGVRGFLIYPFYLSEHHPKLGAWLAEQHGASPDVVQLVATHQETGDAGPRLRALQAADSRS